MSLRPLCELQQASRVTQGRETSRVPTHNTMRKRTPYCRVALRFSGRSPLVSVRRARACEDGLPLSLPITVVGLGVQPEEVYTVFDGMVLTTALPESLARGSRVTR